ncbi:MAG: DUF2274 domain-containing protein [Caulobacteraceae bacterium]
MSRIAKPLKAVALPRIETDEGSKEYKVKLMAGDIGELTSYQEAYKAAHGHALPLETMIPHMLKAFMASDKNFVSWRRSQSAGAN